MRQSGFTLTELMIAVVVMGIVVAFGMPSFLGFQQTLNKRKARAQVLEDIRHARQLAVTRRRQIVMVFGTPPATTNLLTYTMHVDNDGDRFKDGNEPVLLRTLPPGARINQASLTPVDSLIFEPSGALYPGTVGGTLVIGNGRGAPDTLRISLAGMVY